MLKISRTLFDHIKNSDYSKYFFTDPEKIQKLSGNFSIRLLNHLLPTMFKFLRESFNALEGTDILAQISLLPDNYSKYRWQISSLKIKSGCAHAAKPLIDHVIGKYGADGVSTFLVYIDETYPQVISLFKNECGFRSCSKIDFYSTTDFTVNPNDFNAENFRDFEEYDIKDLLEINTYNIFTHFRPSLISNLKDFQKEFSKKFKDDKTKVYVQNGKPCGYFRLYSDDKAYYYADIITSKPYEDSYGEIIAYIKANLINREGVKLCVLLKKYRETSAALEDTLNEAGFSLDGTTQILVKDYWKIINETQSEDKLFVLFNDLTSNALTYSSK